MLCKERFISILLRVWSLHYTIGWQTNQMAKSNGPFLFSPELRIFFTLTKVWKNEYATDPDKNIYYLVHYIKYFSNFVLGNSSFSNLNTLVYLSCLKAWEAQQDPAT